MRDLDLLFERLGRSKFRGGFTLKDKELLYLNEKGLDIIMGHARDFVSKRLAPANPVNDGRQTPMGKHPVFVAQHATATCCRKCLKKWHGIEQQGHKLTDDETAYVLGVIQRWLSNYE